MLFSHEWQSRASKMTKIAWAIKTYEDLGRWPRQPFFDALDQPLPQGRRHVAEDDEGANDRQIWLHGRHQFRERHASEPRVFGLRGRIGCARPLRIVDNFWREFGKAPSPIFSPSDPCMPVLRRAEETPPAAQKEPLSSQCRRTL
ncbi:hypothetical protein NLM31_33345 [Bradyrhizobium sp. CCGUVB4N]|uniref:hypothetical protein n=1 Tax=Bradyrhizobium sp. CCGUVB4N TaxID=2949631 RepID=UPI0020B1A11B|nr:hypothetical protein [Bradyrhizobium sp. CCGUVB4N]MCP3385276.1 hypothetical protein [Bradyrhizobium sp. CCGUVB4N]